MKEAAGLALQEFENFLKRRPASERYLTIMKRVAREPARGRGSSMVYKPWGWGVHRKLF
jgi:hypothetical protein